MKNGARLQSQVCETQVIVVRAAASLDELRCGGAPMIPVDASTQHRGEREPDPALIDGTLMGKRYIDESGAEVLVTKAGVGTLTVGNTTLELRTPKALPASD